MAADLRRRHLRIGWWALLVFASGGAALELLHGLKAGWYLDVGSDTRRLMWTLAHAHGVGLGLVHVALAVTLGNRPAGGEPEERLASWCLTAATVLLPGGFLLGGFGAHGGDPGLGVVCVPAGAVCLVTALAATVRLVGRRT